MSGKRTLIATSLLLCLLMMTPTSLAQTTDRATDTEAVVITTEMTDLDISIDEESGWVNLSLGSSKMYLKYGEGDIELMTVQKRYMGIADIHRGPDDRLVERVGIPMHVLFYQQLNGLAEYVDSNGDGLLNVRSNGQAGSFDELRDSATDHETLLKWINFDDVEWELTRISWDCEGNDCELMFSLSAYNLTYGSLGGASSGGSSGGNSGEVLEELTYLFKLTTREVDIDIPEVRHYRVRAHGPQGSPIIDSSEEIEAVSINHTGIRATWKYDQIIKGWDVATDANGSARNDTRLIHFVDAGFASHLPPKVAQWAHTQFDRLPAPRAMTGEYTPLQGRTHDDHGMPLRCGLDYIHGQHGDVGQQMREYRDTNCVGPGESLDTGRVTNSTTIRSGALQFEDNGRRLGSLRWVSNATIDGVETEVLFQIHGHRPVLPDDVANLVDGVYRGIRLSGGYNLAIGDDIVHDPEYETDLADIDAMSIITPLDGEGGVTPLIRTLLRLAVILVIATVGVVLVVKVRAGKPEQSAPVPDAAAWDATPWGPTDKSQEGANTN